MKVVALLPFKNEEKFLPSYLCTVKPVVDQIIAINDGSTDSGPEILTNAGCTVVDNDEKVSAGWAELGIRNRLLQLGRDSGGTHFVCLDADEAFTTPFVAKAPVVYSKMRPGDKVVMQWLAMWKSVDHYRDDHSVWSNNYKDFVFCDDGKIKYPDVWMHTPRTPGENREDNRLTLNPKHGAVLHWQFSEFTNFQLKQAFYRVSELIKLGANHAANINQKYSISMDDERSKVKRIEPGWYIDTMPKLTHDVDAWRVKTILDYFDMYGIETFERLQIWHIDLLRSEFMKRTGRTPS